MHRASIARERDLARKMEKSAIVVGVIVALFLPCIVESTVHVVGDAIGWDNRQNSAYYSNWAASNKFAVGDVLTFNFTTNEHDVVEVPKASYDGCSTDNAKQTIKNGPANVSLTEEGEHYYICSISGHCQAGQKLAITVHSSSTPAVNCTPSPASSPTPTPQTAPPTTPGNSCPAPSILAAVFFSLGFIALSFCFTM
ncbi:mavicyanin-like [Humulus lupulus]|uniref:mavicyanin-like n=1 Tax=Humulus lupulus TaxID=3486 RepID=UPI002B40F7EA|nr:mavicyanin-like [Humulus lupulus]